MHSRKWICLMGIIFVLVSGTRCPAADEKTESTAPVIVTRYVAIDWVCAWPNLTKLHDGTIVASIFNSICIPHGWGEGDVECWATKDGLTWSKRGMPAPHEKSANRMNVAAGTATNGDLIVLSAGYALKKNDKGRVMGTEALRSWICRSSDGAATWTIDKESFPLPPEGWSRYMPFGDIMPGADGALRAACYAGDGTTNRHAFILRSDDDGKTWVKQARIGNDNDKPSLPNLSEPAIFHLGSGRWLAAVRNCQGKTHQGLHLYRSEDDGQTWVLSIANIMKAGQWPGHLMRLKDGRVLLTTGNRISGQYGVVARLSADEGETWSEPLSLVNDLIFADCGYPSSVQMRDGKVLTAYYAASAPDHRRYHMGVVIWEPPPTGNAYALRTDRPLVPDGKTGEWAGPQGIELVLKWDTPPAAYKVKINVIPKWDETNFYLYAEVCDLDWINNEDGADIWQGDCIQFALGTGKGEWQEYGIARTEMGSQIYRWIDVPGNHTGPVAGGKVEVTRRKDRTIYQLALPWKEIGRTDVKPGAEFGFALVVWDRTNDGEIQSANWSGGILGIKNPALFRKLILADKVAP